ncbi:MAG: peptidoglycan DD-metalloendopeptidase family protein [bacterium]|nr:peptidoglycan DD-metalloendopeptidase family protein [bacterium]
MINRFVFLISAAAGFFLTAFLAGPLSANAQVRTILFPVNGTSSFWNDFYQPRGISGERKHLGNDIIAAKMTPVVALVDGYIVEAVSPQAPWGYSITIEDPDGFQYVYLHLNNDTPGTDDGKGGEANAYAPGIRQGMYVAKGKHIGWVGDSGNAETTVPHLHFEIRAPKTYAAINPFESLALAAAQRDPSGIMIKIAANVGTPHYDEGNVGVVPSSRYIFTKALEQGLTSDEVRQLQMVLNNLGYYHDTYITTYFGPATRAAVVDFQKRQGIDPIGIVGPKTRAALNSLNLAAAVLSGGYYVYPRTVSPASLSPLPPTPPPQPPSVTMPTAATDIKIVPGTSTVTLTTKINPHGAPTIYSYEYGQYVTDKETQRQSIGSGFAEVSATITVTGLLPGREYTFRMIAQNALGKVTGKTFTARTLSQ